MEIRALCIRLLMTIMILLGVQDQKVDAVSLRVVPNRLQFFEYEPVTFHCEGVDYCEVLHKFKGKIKSCIKTNKRTPTGSSCSIQAVYADNSGEYWYEPEGGRRSNIISLSVTAGPVILESPAIPVLMEETVTLSCRNKTHSSNFNSAEFYKNRRSIHKSSTGSMTIQTVFKSDEGRYKCSILGAGESPESWLNVTEAGTSRAMSSAGPRQPVAVDPFYSTKQQVKLWPYVLHSHNLLWIIEIYKLRIGTIDNFIHGIFTLFHTYHSLLDLHV
ncbi:low affinity immunoglobulin gamma Fc region receptor II isoform X6 [Oreochromis niloticus]|uniref:low affinity immunoglobulin gamma Fc region receptor II isoform X6 n=1 Tax=Oreochromis niloticus TaxID=8128 RepID=UPI0009047273|nr:low affinity immunoglobulin gamma Fc region receptor II isoform X6 [Oreochromis niloticus]